MANTLIQDSVGFVLLTGGQNNGAVASFLSDVWSMVLVDDEPTWTPLSSMNSARYSDLARTACRNMSTDSVEGGRRRRGGRRADGGDWSGRVDGLSPG